jgi:hypothetical protein
MADEWDRNDGLDDFYGETVQETADRLGEPERPKFKNGNGHHAPTVPPDTPEPKPSLIKSSKEFVAGFVPPDYLVDGLLQEAFLYSLTGATGAGKTAITLRLAASVLTASKNDNTSELHWQGKFRGVEFAPMHFMLKTVTHERLKDSKGRLMPTVISEWISDGAKEEIAKQKVNDEDRLLALIAWYLLVIVISLYLQ